MRWNEARFLILKQIEMKTLPETNLTTEISKRSSLRTRHIISEERSKIQEEKMIKEIGKLCNYLFIYKC
jgi:hypothetical protein